MYESFIEPMNNFTVRPIENEPVPAMTESSGAATGVAASLPGVTPARRPTMIPRMRTPMPVIINPVCQLLLNDIADEEELMPAGIPEPSNSQLLPIMNHFRTELNSLN